MLRPHRFYPVFLPKMRLDDALEVTDVVPDGRGRGGASEVEERVPDELAWSVVGHLSTAQRTSKVCAHTFKPSSFVPNSVLMLPSSSRKDGPVLKKEEVVAMFGWGDASLCELDGVDEVLEGEGGGVWERGGEEVVEYWREAHRCRLRVRDTRRLRTC